MDPITITLMLMAAGGSIYKGFSGAAAAERQAEVATQNVALLEKQAEIAELSVETVFAKGTLAQHRKSEEVARVLAAQPGHFMAAGLSPTAPTALVAAGYSAAQGEADLEIIRASTALEAAAARTRVANIRGQAYGQAAQAFALEEKATADRISGVLGAGTAALNVYKSGGGTGGNPFSFASPGAPMDINAPGYGAA